MSAVHILRNIERSLKTCAKLSAVDEGMLIHAEIINQGFKTNFHVDQALLEMYSKCSRMSDAWALFTKSPIPDAVSWCTMIQGFVQQRQGLQAIQLFHKMLHVGLKPDNTTLVSILKLCTDMDALHCGKLVYVHILEERLEGDKFIGSTLINLYTKCGCLSDAHRVFDGLEEQNVVAWSTIILGYAEHGHAEVAIGLFKEMGIHGIEPNEVTFLCVLKACSNAMDLDAGKQVHILILKIGIHLDELIGSTLIDMYVSCSHVEDAWKVFDGLNMRNVVTWSIIIAGYQEQGNDEKAIQLYRSMLEEGIQADGFLFVSVLKACVNLEALHQGKSIHLDITKVGLASDIFVGSILVDLYAKCGSVDDARVIFEKLPGKDVVCWSALIAGFASYGCGVEALNVYLEMKENGTQPNEVTFVNLLKACSRLGELDMGKIIHCETVELGLQPSATLGNTFIDMYAKCGSLEDAYMVFDRLSCKDIVSWNTMIGGYVDNGFNCEALDLAEILQKETIIGLDEFTILAILKSSSNMAALDQGRCIHAGVVRRGLEEELVIRNSLVNMYARCGSLEDASESFDNMSDRSAVSWNALIAGCAEHGLITEAKAYFEDMQRWGFRPNDVTFVSLLSGCNHAGLVEEGYNHLHTMMKHHGVTPTIQHYICIIDILGRAGCLEEAECVVLEMPFEPDCVVWMTLLSSCGKHGWLEVGMQAFDYYTSQTGMMNAFVHS